MPPLPPIPIYFCGTDIPYAETVQQQEDFVDQKKEALIFCEHPATITLGTSATPQDLSLPEIYYERQNIPVLKSSRGGKATYHGPGQLVAYPILDLRRRGITIHSHLRCLEEAMIRLAASYGISARRIEGKAGCWTSEKKIGFIGVRIRQGFSFHGLSFNVTPQHDAFRLIVPCGMPNLSITSIEEETGISTTVSEAAKQLEAILLEMICY